jgi:ABC-type dipeptide/oligopeptide/nickel transport system permease component
MKRLVIVFLLIISLVLSANSQTILINNDRISFDSIAADQVLSKFEIKDKIISELEVESSLKDTVILSFYNDLTAVNDSLQSERKSYLSEREQAKKKLKRTIKISILSTIVAFFIGSLF